MFGLIKILALASLPMDLTLNSAAEFMERCKCLLEESVHPNPCSVFPQRVLREDSDGFEIFIYRIYGCFGLPAHPVAQQVRKGNFGGVAAPPDRIL